MENEKIEIAVDVAKEIVENTIEEIKKPLDIQSETLLGKIDEILAEKVMPVVVKTINDVMKADVIPNLVIEKGKKTSLKDWAQNPSISITAILVFVCIVIWNVLSNSDLFGGEYAVLGICVTIGSYFFIMALKRKSGIDDSGVFNALRTIIDIVVSTDEDDGKISRLESVLMMVARELGELYEDELLKLKKYLKKKQAERLSQT